MIEETIFHKFARGEMRPDNVRFEDDEILAFDDIHPNSPVHILIIPKQKIVSIADMGLGDSDLIGRMVYRAKMLAEEMGIAETGYRVSFNIGKDGGQAIPYLHLHLMGGAWPWRESAWFGRSAEEYAEHLRRGE